MVTMAPSQLVEEDMSRRVPSHTSEKSVVVQLPGLSNKRHGLEKKSTKLSPNWSNIHSCV